ncbi:MAG: nickel pincer cofactor biosynthesis protein LarC [Oscillospiraceae bacterium]|nr:nickel pincer cofactor biosynthesis protein LarC [Oscillospiraceae bacterium]
MKTLYLDCGMGAAGDMLAAALAGLLCEPDSFAEEMNSIGLPNTAVKLEQAVKCGITGLGFRVKVNGTEEDGHFHDHSHEHEHHHEHEHEHEHEHRHEHEHEHEHHHEHSHHHHSGMADIEHIVMDLDIPERVKKDVLAVYGLIAEAESAAHGVPVTEIHFHEVGTMDAIADITAVCLLMDRIRPDAVIASPVNVGGGHVRCAHGILPVPAPATAYILKDVPIYDGGIESELCTPTGAALLRRFATEFGNMPVMKVSRIGYGMGKKNFERTNCVRAMLGDTGDCRDEIAELCCNIDDMTGEEMGYAAEKLMEAGALDVFTAPVYMKKTRPGVLLTVLCRPDESGKYAELIFKHTSTIGIREKRCGRYTLDRKTEEIETPYGRVRRKSSSGYGVSRSKPEYDDIARIADETGMSYMEIEEDI